MYMGLSKLCCSSKVLAKGGFFCAPSSANAPKFGGERRRSSTCLTQSSQASFSSARFDKFTGVGGGSVAESGGAEEGMSSESGEATVGVTAVVEVSDLVSLEAERMGFLDFLPIVL